MKSFKQYLIESKKSLHESWNDKKLKDDCDNFLIDVENDKKFIHLFNLWSEPAKKYQQYLDMVGNELAASTLKKLNDLNKNISDNVQKIIKNASKTTVKATLPVCKDLLKRLNDEYKTSDEKEIIEVYINRIKEIEKDLK